MDGSKAEYPWKRYWARIHENTELMLENDAYLPDPEHEYGRFFNENLSHFTEISQNPCALLLGEPGMGKSRSLRVDFKELLTSRDNNVAWELIDLGIVDSLSDLRTQVCGNNTVASWNAGSNILHLCLDSLDEALPSYPALPKALVEIIKTFDKQRLRLSIACRAGEFPPYLENELTSYFGEDAVSKWQIAPLRRKDIEVALAIECNHVDADEFLKNISDRGLEPLAARPITLKLLLAAVKSGSALLPDIWSLYKSGCQRLLSESFDSSRFPDYQAMAIDQKMAVAGRIACITIFGAFSTVSTDPSAVTDGAVVASTDLGGHEEIATGNSFSVNNRHIQEVLKSGLFSALNLFRWAHKSYGEFLAANHLVSNVPNNNQIMSLIKCGDRVAIALRGVTAWLTLGNSDVFEKVLEIDPEVLLYSDLSVATDLNKSRLVAWLLLQAQARSPLLQEFGMSWNYRQLRHSGLKQQLESAVKECRSQAVQYCAIKIAHACGERGLQDVLVKLVLNQSEPMMLRIAAASYISEIGQESAKACLLPLVFSSSSTDDDERLQGNALSAVWPKHCKWEQLRDSIGKVDYSTTSIIGRFVAFDFPNLLPAANITDFLIWLAQADWEVGDLYAWSKAGDKLLEKVAIETHSQDVMLAVVELLFRRLSKHYTMFADSRADFRGETRPWPVEARRAIASALVTRIAQEEQPFAYAYRMSSSLLNRDDIEFVVDRWSLASMDAKPIWQSIVPLLVNWQDALDSAKAFGHTRRFPELHNALKAVQQQVRSDRLSKEQGEAEQRRAKEEKVGERIATIKELLQRAKTDTKAFINLLYCMAFPLDQDHANGIMETEVRELPGWQILEPDEQQTFLIAGEFFIQNGNPHLVRGRREGIETTISASAGYRFLRELVAGHPVDANKLPVQVWERWAPGIVLHQSTLSDSQYQDADKAVLSFAANRAEVRLVRTLGFVIRRNRSEGIRDELLRMGDVLQSEIFNNVVFKSLLSARVAPRVYMAGMRMLLDRSHAGAIHFIGEWAADNSSCELSRRACNSALQLEQTSGTAWRAVWKQMQIEPEFARTLLGVLNESSATNGISEWLTDQQLRDLYLWLRKQFGVPPEYASIRTEIEFVTQNMVLRKLTERATPSSLATLEEIEQTNPDYWDTRKAVWDARRRLVEANWEPLPPRRIKQLVRDHRQLLVRDEQELAEAVCYALEDYQANIRGEGSRVMRLWNEPKLMPKPEESLSREISQELEGILLQRGVMATLESKIRESQFIDIYISTVTADSRRRKLSLIIEVKGCWHRDLKSALKTQLAQRYLKENHSPFGIYLVVWFLCSKWAATDSRKKTTPRTTLTELRMLLSEQADKMNKENKTAIRAIVLDATLEDTPKARKNSRTSKKRLNQVRRGR